MSAINIPCPQCGRELKIRDRSLLGRRAKCPQCSHSFVLEEPPEVELHVAKSPTGGTATAPRWVPDGGSKAASAAPATAAAVASPVAPFGSTLVASIDAEPESLLKKRKPRKSWVGPAIGVVVLLAVAIGGYVALSQSGTADAGGGRRTVSKGEEGASGTGGDKEPSSDEITASPTKGEPISLEALPAGPRVILHLRPAELWEAGSPGEEFRYCLGPLGVHLEEQIQSLCKYPPQEIEELLLAWIPAQRGTPPDLAYVVRLKHDAKKSELLDKLGGERVETYNRPVYVKDEKAAVIIDLKTFAVGPVAMAGEMSDSVGGLSPMPPGIEAVVAKTDRLRHITLMFEPTAVLIDEEFLAPANARNFLRQFMDWFGDDVETAAWSLHLEKTRFYSDMLLRNNTTVRPSVLEERMQERLEALPKSLVEMVRYMHPPELGKRQLIGRIPAMAKVFGMATVITHGDKYVRMITSMPDRGAPNLALGTLLAWDESTRTDFNKSPAAAPGTPASAGSSMTIAAKLQQKIDVDFRRTPLQEAFAFIADETKATHDIDGDALKLSGYTKNMPQSFKLDQVPATQALKEILKQYDKMCIVVDENAKMFLVTTYPVAEQKGLKPFALP